MQEVQNSILLGIEQGQIEGCGSLHLKGWGWGGGYVFIWSKNKLTC